ncbi:MAG TPA: hypothetical protein VME69_00675 [Methylocella sp.]|nr:hypothetical protein [Methylocella sp.]
MGVNWGTWVARNGSAFGFVAHKAYDVFDFIQALKRRKVAPHVTINGTISRNGIPRKTAIDRRTTHHPSHSIILCLRRRIEEILGWIKSTGGLGQLKVRLIRLPKLLETT